MLLKQAKIFVELGEPSEDWKNNEDVLMLAGGWLLLHQKNKQIFYCNQFCLQLFPNWKLVKFLPCPGKFIMALAATVILFFIYIYIDR